jgi:hypothetical protein
MKWFRKLRSRWQLSWGVLGVLILVAVVSIGLSFWKGVTWGDVLLNFGTDMLGAVVIYLLLEVAVGTRQKRESLIASMGSKIKDVAVPAAEELRRAGWLAKGYLRGADLRYANLEGAGLRYADLQGADLRRAILKDTYLRDTNLRLTDLRFANLQKASLVRANLRDANLRKARLEGADLRYAELQDANLDGAKFDSWCRWWPFRRKFDFMGISTLVRSVKFP